MLLLSQAAQDHHHRRDAVGNGRDRRAYAASCPAEDRLAAYPAEASEDRPRPEAYHPEALRQQDPCLGEGPPQVAVGASCREASSVGAPCRATR